jgi:hypothetical protein
LREEAKRDLTERVEALAARRDAGKPMSWSDVDAAEDRLRREAAQRGADVSKVRARAAAFAKEDHADAAAAQTEMAALIEEANAAGLRDGIPLDAAERAGMTSQGGTTSLSGDAAALAALAKAIEGAAGDRLQSLANIGAIDPADLKALERLLESDPVAARMREAGTCPDCHGERPEGCGG